MTLSDFLLARVAEDEAVLAEEPDPENRAGGPDMTIRWANSYCQFDEIAIQPERIRAECEAKRRIVAEWTAVHGDEDDNCDTATGHGGYGFENHDGHADALSVALRALALPYADHPDYREEWRP